MAASINGREHSKKAFNIDTSNLSCVRLTLTDDVRPLDPVEQLIAFHFVNFR